MRVLWHTNIAFLGGEIGSLLYILFFLCCMSKALTHLADGASGMGLDVSPLSDSAGQSAESE